MSFQAKSVQIEIQKEIFKFDLKDKYEIQSLFTSREYSYLVHVELTFYFRKFKIADTLGAITKRIHYSIITLYTSNIHSKQNFSSI